jgi:hypothetical protein
MQISLGHYWISSGYPIHDKHDKHTNAHDLEVIKEVSIYIKEVNICIKVNKSI